MLGMFLFPPFARLGHESPAVSPMATGRIVGDSICRLRRRESGEENSKKEKKKQNRQLSTNFANSTTIYSKCQKLLDCCRFR